MEKRESGVEKNSDEEGKAASVIEGLPPEFYQHFVMSDLRVDLIEPGRIVCSLKVPAHLLNENDLGFDRGAAASFVDCISYAAIRTLGCTSIGVSLGINLSYFHSAYLHEEIEIDGKVLRMGKTIAVVNVEFRKKSNGTLLAQGRLTSYLSISTKL